MSESDKLRDTLRDAEVHFRSEVDALGKQYEMQLSEAGAEVNIICFLSFFFSLVFFFLSLG